MSDKERVIDRVRKLLALAGSANEHESALAAAKAQELMTLHQLSSEDVAEGSTSMVPGAVFVTPNRPELWLEHLVTHVGRLNGCASFLSEMDFGWGLGVVGRPDDLEPVKVLCRFVAPKVIELVKEFQAADKRRGRRAAHSYAIGVVDGVIEKLTEARSTVATAWADSQTALLVIDNRAKKAREYLADSGAGDREDEEFEGSVVARVLGRLRGREIQLQREVGSGG